MIFGCLGLCALTVSLFFIRLRVWGIFFTIGALCSGCSFYSYTEGVRKVCPTWLSMPIRELELVLEVRRSFSSDSLGRLSGIADIKGAPSVRSDLIDKRVYFSLKTKPGDPVASKGWLVRAIGLLKPISATKTNGFEHYLHNVGIGYEFRNGTILESTDTSGSFERFCFVANNKLEGILLQGNEEVSSSADIGVAMILGKKASLHPENKERFLQAGVMHLFAISGLHVGVVATFLALILRWLPGPKFLEALCGLTLLFLYVKVTGGMPSAMRAFTMVAFWWFARLLGRPGSAFSAMVASAFFALLLNPRDMWNLGFQLSYCVVAAIILYGVPLASRLQSAWEPWSYRPAREHTYLNRCVIYSWKWFSGALSVSFAATLASAPLTMGYFGIFTPGAILLNVFLVLLAGTAIICGFVSIIFGLASMTFLSSWINHLLWGLISLMDWLVDLCLGIPGFAQHVEVTSPRTVTLAVVATLALFLIFGRRIRFAASWICMVPLAPLLYLYFFETVSTH